jgi:hypothetical protein
MGVRGLGAVLGLAAVGVAGGFAVGNVLREDPVPVAEATPVPASSPSLPVDPERPFAPDIDYPALQPGLTYQRHTLGELPYAWVYSAPKGWAPYQEDTEEIRWRPADEPEVGGFSMRVKRTTEHQSKSDMVAQKLAAMLAGYDDVEILGRTGDLLSFSYRDATRNTRRFNTFRWFSVPGETEARFEMSVVGREVDRAGLDDLLEQVSRSVAKVQ